MNKLNVNSAIPVNTKPWSGLGAKIDPSIPLDESLANAELDWDAKRTQTLFNVDGKLVVGTSHVLYRSDNLFELGKVTDKYKISQPREIIQGYIDLASLKNWPLEYMGTMDGGRRIWALAKTDRVSGTKEDPMNTYLLLTTTYDGSSGTIGKFLNLTNDCTSLSLAVGDNSPYAKFSINHKSTFDVKKLEQKLNLLDKAGKNFEGYTKKLSNLSLEDKDVVEFLIKNFEGKDVPVDELSTRQGNIIKSVFETYKSHYVNNGLGLIQTIAQHVDYNVGRNVNNRMRAAWFGDGDKLKVGCFNSLLKIA